MWIDNLFCDNSLSTFYPKDDSFNLVRGRLYVFESAQSTENTLLVI